MALVGYARVSTQDQSLEVQLEQLKGVGCDKIFAEQKSGLKLADRGELDKCLSWVREGDILIVTRIDRLARSVRDFNELMKTLEEKGVGFRCLLQPFDTTAPTGRLMRDILAAFAEFEATVRAERQREGIERAKAEGKYSKIGPNGVRNSRMSYASRLLRAGATYAQVAEKTEIPANTLRRRFPNYNTKPYSRNGGTSKRPFRPDDPKATFNPALPPPSVPDFEPIEVEMETKKPGVMARLFGGG